MAGNIIANVFRQDPFSGVTLTEQINKVPYVPQLLGSLGLFNDLPIRTTALQINERDGQLTLIPTSPRGAPKKQWVPDNRAARYFNCPRIATEFTLHAYQLQNVMSDNPDQLFKTMQEEVARRLSGPVGLTMNRELTLEYHRLGAVQGVLVDSNGAVINNWFNEFEITPTAEVVLYLNDPVVTLTTGGTPAGSQRAGALRIRMNQVVRTMQVNGRGAFIPGVTEIHALCGHQFYDSLTSHPDVTSTFVNWNPPTAERENAPFQAFYWGGVYWHDYRGTDDQSTIVIPQNKAAIFPKKAPGVFQVAWAPGEGFEDLNEPGKPMYVERNIDQSDNPKWVEYSLLSFPLHICTRPEMLMTATMDDTAD